MLGGVWPFRKRCGGWLCRVRGWIPKVTLDTFQAAVLTRWGSMLGGVWLFGRGAEGGCVELGFGFQR